MIKRSYFIHAKVETPTGAKFLTSLRTVKSWTRIDPDLLFNDIIEYVANYYNVPKENVQLEAFNRV